MDTLTNEDPGSKSLEEARAHHPADSEDMDIEAIDSEEKDQESTPSQYEIMSYPADFTLEVLHEKFKRGDITIPHFQRDFVWKKSQASKLIESFLLGLPVPPIFLYQKDGKLLVIDGQQRLKSIVYFFEGHFKSDESRSTQSSSSRRKASFKLIGLNDKSRFNNKTFEMLEATQKEDYLNLKNSILRSIIIRQLDPEDDTSMYNIFERLNTGGTLLTGQEIRNCIYYSNFVEFLNEINKYPLWRKIIGKKQVDRQRKDTELIVRFFAMRDISNYGKPMKNYLSSYMNKHRDITDQKLEDYRKLFDQTCEKTIHCLGEKPFHLRSGLNPPALDSVMVAFSYHLDAIPNDIHRRYECLKKDEEFNRATRQGTTDKQMVNLRFQRAKSILFGE